jgi:plasmid stabilization system protein ParE
MTFRVDISPSALKDAENSLLWMEEFAPTFAHQWFNGLLDAIYSLEKFPSRCQLASEAPDIRKEVRQLRYGDYRILFLVRGSEPDGIVQVLRVRHIAQERLTAEEI